MRLNHARKVIFRKSQKLLAKRALSELHGHDGGSLFRTFNSYSFNFNGAHTRLTGTAGRVHCVRIFTHFPCYEPACWSLNFMHFQTSVIRLVDRLT